MSVVIDQVDVETSAEPTPATGAQKNEPPPDPHEIECLLQACRERIERVRAH